MFFKKRNFIIFILLSCFFVQAGKTRDLFKAVQSNNIEKVRRLIERGADVNSDEGWFDQSPLHQVQSLQVAKLLMNAGANVNALDYGGDTPLSLAKSPKIAAFFIEAGANPHAKLDDEFDISVLEWNSNVRRGMRLVQQRRRQRQREQQRLREQQQRERQRLREQQKRSEQKQQQAQIESMLSGDSICKYTGDSSEIKTAQCGQNHLCLAEVSCSFKLGVSAPSSIRLIRSYQAVCSALPKGQCPTADQCVLDRSVVTAERSSKKAGKKKRRRRQRRSESRRGSR